MVKARYSFFLASKPDLAGGTESAKESSLYHAISRCMLQIDETAGSHTKKMQLSTFLKPVGENHCVKYYKHILFKDSPLSGTLSVGIEALNPEVGIKFVYATEGF